MRTQLVLVEWLAFCADMQLWPPEGCKNRNVSLRGKPLVRFDKMTLAF